MAGPLHAPNVLFLYPFRYRHELTGKWVKARYVAERHEIAARYRECQSTGPPEILRGPSGGYSFNPWRPTEPPRRPGRWPIVGVAT